MVWLVRHCYVEGDAVLLAWWSLAARRLNFVLNWISLLTVSIVSLTQILKQRTKENRFIAFDKERLHSAVSFENFGLSIHGHQFGHPEKFFRGEIIQGEWRNFHRACALFLAGVEFHVLSCVLVCFLVKFDLLFVFSVLSRQILACASLFIHGVCVTLHVFRYQHALSTLTTFRSLRLESRLFGSPICNK